MQICAELKFDGSDKKTDIYNWPKKEYTGLRKLQGGSL